MSIKKRGLGKGLNELLSATLGASKEKVVVKQKETTVAASAPTIAKENKPASSSIPTLCYLPIDQLVPGPYQPRQIIVQETLEQLAESIRTQGVIQPIVVRPLKEDSYEIIAGERRWRAAKLAGLTVIPAILKPISDDAAMIIALIENIQRQDLTPLEEAKALKRLSEKLSMTHLQVAESLGKSRTTITNSLRLLTLNEEVQLLLEQQLIEMGHARALLALKGPLQTQIAQTVAQKGLSVRETEKLVAKLQEGVSVPDATQMSIKQSDPNIRRLEEELANKLGANVAIKHASKGNGSLIIRYHTVDELEGILAHIN